MASDKLSSIDNNILIFHLYILKAILNLFFVKMYQKQAFNFKQKKNNIEQ